MILDLKAKTKCDKENKQRLDSKGAIKKKEYLQLLKLTIAGRRPG